MKTFVHYLNAAFAVFHLSETLVGATMSIKAPKMSNISTNCSVLWIRTMYSKHDKKVEWNKLSLKAAILGSFRNH